MLKKLTPQEIALDLANDIESGRLERFDMNEYHNCGTPSCMAGHLVARYGDFDTAAESVWNDVDPGTFLSQSAEILGINLAAAVSMFVPPGVTEYSKKYNAAAPAMLRYWAETGEVKWDIGDTP